MRAVCSYISRSLCRFHCLQVAVGRHVDACTELLVVQVLWLESSRTGRRTTSRNQALSASSPHQARSRLGRYFQPAPRQLANERQQSNFIGRDDPSHTVSRKRRRTPRRKTTKARGTSSQRIMASDGTVSSRYCCAARNFCACLWLHLATWLSLPTVNRAPSSLRSMCSRRCAL